MKIITLIRASALILMMLFFYSSCSNLLAPAKEIIKSEMVNGGDLKKYAQFPKTKTLGIKWNKHRDADGFIQPVTLNLPAASGNESFLDPCIIKTGVNTYHMWYTMIDVVTLGGLPVKKYTIRYATSADGIEWNDETSSSNVPVTGNKLESLRISSVIVTKDNPTHTYRMWYLGKTRQGSETGWKLYYAYTNSIDDPATITWETERCYERFQALTLSLEGFDSTNISRASIFKEENGEYKMWYGGHKTTDRKIGYATSQDGRSKWAKKYEIISKGFAAKNRFDIKSVEYPWVIKDEGVYKMWYSGSNLPWEIGLAYSLDGRTFDYYDNQFGENNDSVLKPETYWEGRGVLNCSVIKDSDDGQTVYKMWYSAEGNDGKFRIGYAESY